MLTEANPSLRGQLVYLRAMAPWAMEGQLEICRRRKFGSFNGTMRKNVLILAILILVPIGALMLRVEFQSPRRPNVSITFLGYTNDPSGSRLAQFAVSNAEPSAVQVYGLYVEIQKPTGGVGYWPPRVFGNGVLRARTSMMFTIVPPTNQAPWRIYFHVDPDVGVYRNIKHFAFYQMLKVGLKPKYQTMPYGFFGNWIKDDNGHAGQTNG